MISYLKFKELWKAIENDSLNLAEYLQDIYWRSMLYESEMRRAVALIADVQKAKNFAEFLSVFDCPTFCFADMFDRDLIEVERWVQRDTPFPRHLKKSYAFMLLTNHLACETTFVKGKMYILIKISLMKIAIRRNIYFVDSKMLCEKFSFFMKLRIRY